MSIFIAALQKPSKCHAVLFVCISLVLCCEFDPGDVCHDVSHTVLMFTVIFFCVCVCVSSTSISEKTDMSPETGKLEAFRVKHPSSVLPL